ncbi:phenylacetate--CoA ligase family protein [soil metagenome]
MQEQDTSTPGFSNARNLLQRAALEVPAYKEFLASLNVSADDVNTPEDFAAITPVTKENYLKAFPLKELMWNGSVMGSEVISNSSGSSGKPFFWPRNVVARQQSVDVHRNIFQDIFKIKEDEPTLVIVGFAMGSWIAGTYTFAAVLKLREDDNLPITLATPGINKIEIVRLLQEIAPLFKRVILAGYPPFVKDVLDEAKRQGVDLPSLPLNLLFAGENFSENWRDYVLHKIGREESLDTSVTIYGTADAGLLGHENPFTVFVRRTALAHPAIFEKLFPGTSSIPSLVTYYPEQRYFEEVDGNLIFSADNSLPLIRYQIGDQGRLVSGAEIWDVLKANSISIPAELESLRELPYLTIYGRTDVATTFYALDIYPENIRYGLEDRRFDKYLTGKFVLKTDNHPVTQEQILNLKLELKPDVQSIDVPVDDITEAVLMSLKKFNSEFSRLYQEIGAKAHPNVVLLPTDSPEFTINIKHRWNQR